MYLFKKSLLSPVVALLISTTVYADDISYSIEKQSLKEAIELISKSLVINSLESTKNPLPFLLAGR